MASRRSGMRRPSSSIRPASARRMPPRQRSVVDLPAPFWPSRTRISPRSTCRSTPATARTSAKLLCRPSTRITWRVLFGPVEQRLHVVADLELDLVARAGGVEADEALRLGGSQPLVGLGDLAVELKRLLFHAVLPLTRRLVAAEAGLDVAYEQERDVRTRETRWPRRRQPAGTALVGERGVVVAVGDHDLRRRQRRRDDLGDQLPARGHEEVHLGLGVDLEAPVEEGVADLLAQLRAAGLADEHRVALLQPLGEQLGLGGLARALRALERNEEPPLRHEREVSHAPAGDADPRHRRPEPRKGWRDKARTPVRNAVAPGPLTQASAPAAPGRLGRVDASRPGGRHFGY